VSGKINVNDNSGVLTIKGNTIQQVRRFYNLLEKGTVVIFLVTLLSAALCVILSVHHAKTARRILMGIGIISLLLAVALQAPSYLIQSTNQLQQKATMEIVNTILHNLQLSSLVFGIACVVVSLGSKIYSDHFSKKLKS
jgi:NADH:ubiquinone oxidoreductase subunit 4 (subunit M)